MPWDSIDNNEAGGSIRAKLNTLGTSVDALLQAEGGLAIEGLGAVGDGTTDDTAAFTAAAATGRDVRLTANTTYLMSAGVSCVSGTRFVCDGIATIKLKTGSGGFNVTDLNGAQKNNLDRCVFLFNATDNVGMSGIRFTTDGAAERVLYPIRVMGGCATLGCHFERIRFQGLSVTNGGYLSLNSIGAGSYRVHDIEARDCTSALTSWTGTPQISVFEIDNDLIGGVNSEPGYFSNIRGINVQLTGAAATTYGSQTDVVNIAGGSTRKGPAGHGIYGDGVGEVLDCFADHSTITGVRGRNCRSVAKLVHGASHNYIELIAESWSEAAVELAGSTNIGVTDTAFNTVIVNNAVGGGTIASTNSSELVLFQQNGGTTGRPKNNLVVIDNASIDSNLDYLVKDNNVNSGNNNQVIIRKLAGTPGVAGFDVADATNTRVQGPASITRMTMSASQTLTTTVAAALQFNTAAVDRNSEANTSTYKIRAKYPGRKRIKAQIRSSLNTGGQVKLSILKAGAEIAFASFPTTSGADAFTYAVDTVNEVSATEAGKVDGEFSILATITSTGTITVENTPAATFFEVVDLD